MMEQSKRLEGWEMSQRSDHWDEGGRSLLVKETFGELFIMACILQPDPCAQEIIDDSHRASCNHELISPTRSSFLVPVRIYYGSIASPMPIFSPTSPHVKSHSCLRAITF